jgi:hypothetical protein
MTHMQGLVPQDQAQDMRQRLVDYLLTHYDPLERTQVNMIRALQTSQATLVKYLSELKGEGLVIERPFGTAVIYQIQYDIGVGKGIVEKYKIFDLDLYAKAHRTDTQGWKAYVFDFGPMVYIFARHKDGFTIGIPIFDKDLKELVQAFSLGLQFETIITALGQALQGR